MIDIMVLEKLFSNINQNMRARTERRILLVDVGHEDKKMYSSYIADYTNIIFLSLSVVEIEEKYNSLFNLVTNWGACETSQILKEISEHPCMKKVGQVLEAVSLIVSELRTGGGCIIQSQGTDVKKKVRDDVNDPASVSMTGFPLVQDSTIPAMIISLCEIFMSFEARTIKGFTRIIYKNFLRFGPITSSPVFFYLPVLYARDFIKLPKLFRIFVEFDPFSLCQSRLQ
eukprot:TRINITY_DN27559_c0_g1_i1.p1 TRINITY_DN27559_c0_g1~~TRINITY_DN27559_c0_g1_i1.p1  ORF type:complete len:228 (-),score=47.01 TRINITY_DN27559_c0_g1_i1:301-984(-)